MVRWLVSRFLTRAAVSLSADGRSLALKWSVLCLLEFPTASHVGGMTVYANQFTKLIERAVETTAEKQQ